MSLRDHRAAVEQGHLVGQMVGLLHVLRANALPLDMTGAASSIDVAVDRMFSKGAELLSIDSRSLLVGTGKVARHIKIESPALLHEPQVRELIGAAAALTPRDTLEGAGGSAGPARKRQR